MPLSTETYTFAEEIDRLETAKSNAESELEEFEDGWENEDVEVYETDKHETLSTRVNHLTSQLRGAQWAAEHFECDSVTFGELSSGEFAAVQKRVSTGTDEQERKNIYVGIGTVDAPYVVEGDPNQTILNVADNCHPYYVIWADTQISGLLWRADWGN